MPDTSNQEKLACALKALTGAKFKLGYKYPFGGWINIHHRFYGKLGLLYLSKKGIFICGQLPKVKTMWASPVNGFTIKDVFVQGEFISVSMSKEYEERLLIITLKNGGNIVVLTKDYSVIWSAKIVEAEKILKILTQNERKEIEPLSQSLLYEFAAVGTKEFHKSFQETLERTVRKTLKKRLKSIRRTLSKIREDYYSLGEPAKLRRLADVIMANLHRIPPKTSEATVFDPYKGEEVNIKLDPGIPPVKFAEKLYSKARRAERGRKQIVKRYRELLLKERELKALEKISSVDLVAEKLGINPSDVLGEPIQDKLRVKVKSYGAGIKRFISSDGFEILVGRSKEANNKLTFSVAAKDDIWLHAESVKGAHVVIKTSGRKPSQNTILEAASLAAFYSDAKHASLVPVVFTKRKYVHPIKGQIGKVRLDQWETVMVEPKESIT